MDFLRTPDSRFVGLEAYSFGPNHVDVDAHGARHCGCTMSTKGPRRVPRGAAARRADLELPVPQHDCATGATGHRVLAPDLIGFRPLG